MALVFDHDTKKAVPFPFDCPHELWVDAAGYYVLVAKTFRASGGVSLNEDALAFLQGLGGSDAHRQVYLNSKTVGWTWGGRLKDLPRKEPVLAETEKYGRCLIRVYDREDLYPAQQEFPAQRPPNLPAAANVGGAALAMPEPEASQEGGAVMTFVEWLRSVNQRPNLKPTNERLEEWSLIHKVRFIVQDGKTTVAVSNDR